VPCLALPWRNEYRFRPVQTRESAYAHRPQPDPDPACAVFHAVPSPRIIAPAKHLYSASKNSFFFPLVPAPIQFKPISIPPAASFRSQAGRACMQIAEGRRNGMQRWERTCSPCDVDLSVWANAAAARSAGHLTEPGRPPRRRRDERVTAHPKAINCHGQTAGGQM
jgi:hypothetical protein